MYDVFYIETFGFFKYIFFLIFYFGLRIEFSLSFMFRTLENFCFGEQFIKMIKTLYNEPIFKIENNEWLSKRGIRQGCPVSALLFVLVIEILAVQIKKM